MDLYGDAVVLALVVVSVGCVAMLVSWLMGDKSPESEADGDDREYLNSWSQNGKW